MAEMVQAQLKKVNSPLNQFYCIKVKNNIKHNLHCVFYIYHKIKNVNKKNKYLEGYQFWNFRYIIKSRGYMN